ncbi:MAG: TlpA disulfide reductase family protein [Candidatus Nitrosopolaris sp.]
MHKLIRQFVTKRHVTNRLQSLKSKTVVTIVVIVIALVISCVVGVSISNNNNTTTGFNLNTIGGKQVSLESFKGKPLVLWFMDTWCPTCVGQAGAIKQVSSEYGNKINVFVIDLWATQNIGQSFKGLNAETMSDLQAFIAKYGSPQWNAALDDGVTIKYGITRVDSTVILDSNGKPVFTNLGPSGYEPLKDALGKVMV